MVSNRAIRWTPSVLLISVGRALRLSYPTLNRMNAITLFKIILALFIPMAAVVDALSSDRPTLLEGHQPSFPAGLQAGDTNNGFATLACAVDDDGSVIETWALEASHSAFASSATRALEKWRYLETIGEENSLPWPRIDLIRFEFERSGQITTKTHGEAIRDAFPTSRPKSHSGIRYIPLLDPEGIVRLAGELPAPLPDPKSGEVIVEFLVDSQGNAHLPIAIAATHKDQARACVEAVREWNVYLPDPSLAAPAGRVQWTFRFR